MEGKVTAVTPAKKQTFLEFFPQTIYAAVSSLSALSAAWGLTGWEIGLQLKGVLGMISMVIFILVSVIFALKWWHYPHTWPDIHEICLFFLVTALLFTAILVVVIFTRLLFQAELAAPMYPTLLLLSVPFSMTYSVYDMLTGGGVDLVAAFLFYGALFMAAVFGGRILFCMIKFQFSVSFWTVSFPLAALTVAAFRYAHHSTIAFVKIIPFILLAGTSIIILALFFQTFHFIIAEYIVKGCPKPAVRMTYREFIHGSQHR